MGDVGGSDDGMIGLRVEREGPISRLLIDRPERRNALTQAMWADLPEIIQRLDSEGGIRVLIVGSTSPGVFSAGADISEYRDHADDLEWSAASQKVVARGLEAVAAAVHPTLAVIDGPCFGGGAGLAVACDFRIATARSTFAITPAKLGMVYPHTATVSLVDLVGARHAKRILFTGETMDAEHAERIGLVDQVVPDAMLDQAVSMFIDPLLSASGMSARSMKRTIRRIANGERAASDHSDAVVEEALRSSDYREGVTAFLERRAPRFES